MHFRLKTTLLVLLGTLLLAALAGFAACAGTTPPRDPAAEWTDVDGCEGAVVYSPAAFNAAKNNWYGGEGSLLTEAAESGAISDVSVGSEYYLVYTKTHIKDEYLLGDVPFSFAMRQQNALLEQADCVALGELFYDESCTNQSWYLNSDHNKIGWSYDNAEYVETEDGFDYITDYVFSYAVLPFTPLQAGQLVVTCGEDTLYLNVVAAENAGEGAFAEISSPRMAIAEAGLEEELSFSASLAETVYINSAYKLYIEFDVTALETESRKQFTCAILYDAAVTDLRVDEADTNDFMQTKFGEKDALLLRFSVPLQAGQKETYRIVVGLNAAAVGEVRIDPAFLSEQGHLEGDLFGASCTLSSQEGEELTDGEFTYRYLWETQSYEITGWKYYGTIELDLPDTFRGLPVSRVGERAFSGIGMKRLILGNEIVELAASAFSDCDDLEEVVFNNKLERIGNSAFSGCSALQSVDLPASVREIGNSTFKYCGMLQEFVWPASISSIADGTFSGSGLQKITFAGTVTEIGSYAFSACGMLQEFVWPASVPSIADGTFAGSGLQKISFAGTVTEIGESAFSNCDDLTSIELPAALEVIGDFAFAYTPLQSVYLPASVREIGDSAFSCGSDFYSAIGGWYQRTYSLQEIVVDPENEHYASLDGVLFTKDMKMLLLYPLGSVRTEYIVPEGVTEIESGAFAVRLSAEEVVPTVPALRQIVLPSTLQTICSGAFEFDVIWYIDGEGVRGIRYYSSITFTDGGDWRAGGTVVTAEELKNSLQAAKLLSDVVNSEKRWSRIEA